MYGMTKADLPDWVSSEVFRYLEHTTAQVPIRKLARKADCHASTILRQIRRLEQRREDPLVDGALQRLSQVYYETQKTARERIAKSYFCEEDAARCLTLLSHPGAVLVAGRGMAKAVILREIAQEMHKTVLDLHMAEVLALLDWVSCFSSGQVYRYRITREGRLALAALIAEAEERRRHREESTTQSGLAGRIGPVGHKEPGAGKRARYGLQETPLQTLARLVDRDGNPFLTLEMVRAGERIREDFELAQIGQHVAHERAIFAGGAVERDPQSYGGPARDAFQRTSAALCALGPGLSDIALRCCCHLEGLEAAERDLGWSARSGKIVLRIALEQLAQHYAELPPRSQMIG